MKYYWVTAYVRKDTIDKVSDLQDWFGGEWTRTDTIVRSVRMCHDLLKAKREGCSVRIHEKNGTIRELVL